MALEAKHSFVSTYWAYRSYLASRLPSVTLYGNLMNYDRSLTLLQSYEDGTFKYAETFNLQTATEAKITLFFADVDADMDFFHNLHCF